jgi:hypothetical protein
MKWQINRLNASNLTKISSVLNVVSFDCKHIFCIKLNLFPKLTTYIIAEAIMLSTLCMVFNVLYSQTKEYNYVHISFVSSHICLIFWTYVWNTNIVIVNLLKHLCPILLHSCLWSAVHLEVWKHIHLYQNPSTIL